MTRVILIHAGPTPWDVEDRIVGNHPLPLTELGLASVQGVVANLPAGVTAVYRNRKNEACEQVAQLVAQRFRLKPHHTAALDEVNLGLWQGLTRAELRFRHARVEEQWRENPLAVHPPEGERLEDAIERLGHALRTILRRNRGGTVVLALRPMAMQIALGLLQHEDAATIAAHLRNSSPVETIELADEHQHL